LDPSDSSLKFSGFYRYSQVATQGLVNFSIPAEALEFLKTGDISTLSLAEILSTKMGLAHPLLYISKHFQPIPRARHLKFMRIMAYRLCQPAICRELNGGVLNDEDYG
jgi:hypothetical protein